MTAQMIQQQMYTRERGGIFHTTDGYDTIAISPGLDHTFVKKYLHPFCIYQSPKSLISRGEKDAVHYPEAITLFQPETGDLVIGQAVFVPADFTGQRSAYFMHNYIIPSGRKEEWIKQPEKLFQITDFATTYPTEQGKVLPVREDLGYEAVDVLAGKNQFLAKLGISHEQFKQLLFAVMTSIGGKKKVFISLNVPMQEYSQAALQLLELVYLYLPYAYRSKLGTMTFSSEPEGKNYIHVMFYEPGTLHMNDRSIEKQFIFDFANGRISGVKTAGQKHEYLEFVLEHFSQSKRIDAFFEFAEMALSGLPEQQKIEAASYYQLTDLYLTLNESDLSLYEKNKLSFLHGILKFLQVNGAEKIPLIELFEKVLTAEKYVQDPTMALEYINTVVAINKLVTNRSAFSFILQTLDYYRNQPLFHQIWKTLEQDRNTHEIFVRFLHNTPAYAGLLRLYLEERMKPLHRVEEVLNEIQILLKSPCLLEVDLLHTIIVEKVALTIRDQSNPFPSVLAISQFEMDIVNPKFTSFKKDMLNSAKVALLNSLQPKKLSIQEILTFGKIFPTNLTLKDEQAMRNYSITHLLYQLLSHPASAASVSFHSLLKNERELVREILQQLLQSKITAEQFPLLFVAYGSEYTEVDYQALLKHLVQYSDGKTIVSFVQANGQLVGVNKAYRQALKTYFISNSDSVWRNKMHRKELELIRNSSFKNFLKEVGIETANPLIKFLKKRSL